MAGPSQYRNMNSPHILSKCESLPEIQHFESFNPFSNIHIPISRIIAWLIINHSLRKSEEVEKYAVCRTSTSHVPITFQISRLTSRRTFTEAVNANANVNKYSRIYCPVFNACMRIQRISFAPERHSIIRCFENVFAFRSNFNSKVNYVFAVRIEMRSEHRE